MSDWQSAAATRELTGGKALPANRKHHQIRANISHDDKMAAFETVRT